jgi:hypothetical protein
MVLPYSVFLVSSVVARARAVVPQNFLGVSLCYDLTSYHTIIKIFSSDFHDAAYCKDLYLFMVRHVHILLCTFL